jgi:cytochrome b
MMETVTTTHAAVALLVVGYLTVGLVLGWIIGYSRGERKGYAREQASVDYYIKALDRTRALLAENRDA